MKHLIIIITAMLVFIANLVAQDSVDDILTEVEQNNTTLQALRKSADAQKIGNKTGNFLQNPEVEFNYLWGDPSPVGTRTDFSVLQSFDFPTAYGFKNQISDLKNEQAELEYQKQLKSIQLETRLICYDLIYTNALIEELEKRLGHAQSIVKASQAKFDSGEAGILELNKAKINALNIRKELESIGIERHSMLSELARLNGGQKVAFSVTAFEMPVIPGDFEQWYESAEQNNTVFRWLRKEVEISQAQTGLNRAMSLPKFQAGYMSESVVGEQFQGVSVGVSVPLWENKNKVKFARANALAAESMASDYKLQFYNKIKIVHTKALSLQDHVKDYRSSLQPLESTSLLKKALDSGEISLINYILELSFYYESVNKMLEMERDLSKSVAELNQYR